MGVLKSIVVTAMLATQAAELPPPFPRPGTTKILENDAVAVWDVSWLKQKYPLHTHRYDLVGISYAEGDRIITQGDAPGRLVTPRPGCSRPIARVSRTSKKAPVIRRCVRC